MCIIILGMKEDNVILMKPGTGGTKKSPRRGILAFVRHQFEQAFLYQDFANTWRNVPVTIRFRCTNRCNENCICCFECSGPNNPLHVLPVADIAFYQNAMQSLQGVFMTGGEWSLIYDVDADYMWRVFDALDLRCADAYHIQTNCRWVFGPHSEKIYADLRRIQDKLSATGKVLKLDVSVDRYRSAASLDGVRELICRIGADNHFQNTKIRILSTQLDYGMTGHRILQPDYFKARGVALDFEPRNIMFPLFQVFYVNGKRMVIHEENVTMNIGRAAENKMGYKIVYPEKQCAGLTSDDRYMELSFREDGTVKWHGYYDWDIMTPYRDAHGQNKPIEQIKQELIQKAWRHRLKQNCTEALWSMIPIVRDIRSKRIHRQITDSYRQNEKKIVYRANWQAER